MAKKPITIATAPTGMRYVGDGAALPDVPARDLTPAEAARYDVAALLRSGLYVAPEPAPEQTEDSDGSRA